MTTAPDLLLVLADSLETAALREALVSDGFLVRHAATPLPLAVLLPQLEQIDLLVLEPESFSLTPMALCASLRATAPALVLLVLLRGGEEQLRVAWLDAGADDVLGAPFGQAELLARCRALVRRSGAVRATGGSPAGRVLACNGLQLVEEECRAWLHGRPLVLTPREFRLLAFLLNNRGRAWSRDALLERVWGQDAVFEVDPKTVDVHIRWLRRKLEADPANPRLIVTVRGEGYRLG